MIVGFSALISLFPTKKLFLSLPTRKDFKEVALFGGYSFLANVSLLSMGVFDKLIIGVLMNPAAVALYSIPMSLVSKVEQVLVKFAQALFPHFSEIADSSSGNKLSTEKTLHVFDISIDASFFVALGAGSLLFILAEPILKLWMGADFAMQATWILRGLIAGYTIKILNVLPTYILYSQKKPAINAIAYSVSGAAYIILIALLINKVSLGALSFCSIVYLISYVILLRSISNSLQKNIVWYLFPYFVAAIIGSICVYAIIYVGFFKDVLVILVGGLVFSIAYFFVSVFVASLGLMKDSRSMRIYHQLPTILYPYAKR
jgi:O-antigen/teichoic acid export membrane protein